MGNDRRRRAGKVLLRVGLLFLLAALVLVLYNIWDARRADQAAQAVVEQLESQIEEDNPKQQDTDSGMDEEKSGSASAEARGELSDEREMPTIEIDGYRYIGYLSVPSTGQELPVMEEWDYDRLRIAPCRYSGTVYQNNMVIAGHNYRSHFSPLRWLPIGTEIVFTDVENQEYHYEIADIETLNPEQVEDMVAESDDWDLTLFTCTIGGQARYTIRCIRTEE